MRRALLLCSFGLCSCFYPADRGRLLEAKVDALTSENARLGAELKGSQEKLQQALDKVQTALDGLDKASRMTDADIGVQLRTTVQDVASLRGTIEEYQHRVAELENALKKVGDGTASLDKPGSDAGDTKKKDDLKRPDDPKAYLALANDTAKTDAALAQKLYGELLKKWPKAAEAGDAHFAVGEHHYGADRCREAIYEYGKVIIDFPKAKGAPEAYLHSSDCFVKLKMYDEAKQTLEELSKNFAKSEAAKQVKAKLAEVAKAKAKGGKK